MSKSNQSNWDVIVVGGGPAGFFAAIRCAELNPKLRVLIIEKSSQTLGKVLISGGGRCNVTHACFDPAQLDHLLSARRHGFARRVHALSTRGYGQVV